MTLDSPSTAVQSGVARASWRETLALAAEVVIPTVAKGPIIRRRRVEALAERLQLDQRAVRRLQRLRNRHAADLLLLPIPYWRYAVALRPAAVRRVLAETPEPFATASWEKRAALAHVEPRVALISHGPARDDRRRFNEAALDTARPVHRLGERFATVVAEEAAGLRASALDWPAFADRWFRVIRRVVLGDEAADDRELRALLDHLRGDGNWAFLRRRRDDLRQRFYARLTAHLERAEPGSLAAVIAATPTTAVTAPADQVAHWLFASDPAGMATFRALALLASHPAAAIRARAEASARAVGGLELPFLRACVLESLRLWPTTPAVLRQSVAPTRWGADELPGQTGLLLFAPFFHRDDQRLPYAHRFAPELWEQERTDDEWSLIPFSAGPAVCPGQQVVLLLTSLMLAELIAERRVHLQPASRLDPRRLSGTLNHFSLRFQLAPLVEQTTTAAPARAAATVSA